MAEKIKYEPKLLLLRIKLEYIRPFIVRKVVVRNTISFADLHDIIQITMGWENEHLYSFSKGNIYIDDDHGDDEKDDFFNLFPSRNKYLSASNNPIARFLNEPKDKVKYEYDFGDSWLHQISVSKVLENDPRLIHPVCKKASRACPPEDCGGVYGYYRILNALNSEEKDEDDESYLEWVGEDYNPEFTDIDIINSWLRKIKM
ncbi:MAG: plasmid pRiA4b ORF-3 family protein [Candidatus Cloacimonetes bacterium]|nr:plasmid pRiA4b ORF-3 family protein [Candidatus Cloacimonadota bacterium]